MPSPSFTKLLAKIVLILFFLIFPGAKADAELFCVKDRGEFLAALSRVAANAEDNTIRIASGALVGRFKMPRSVGFSLRIEGGFDEPCVQRVKAGQAENATEGSIEAAKSGPVKVEKDNSFLEPQQSTTGPVPSVQMLPEETEVEGSEFVAAGGSASSLGVPAYQWRHGCGPTALGMLVGYYDGKGFPELFEGDALVQTYLVNQRIASERDESDPGHYEDYSLPIDSYPNLSADKSASPDGDEHVHDSIADFMRTSWSSIGNRYGWSWSTDIKPAFQDYVAFRNAAYLADVSSYSMPDGLTWAVLTSEIDNGRPMVFLVDTDGDGQTDHFVTVVAYNDAPTRKYGCLNTWDNQIHWFQFAEMGVGQQWGIWGGWSFNILLQIAPGDADGNGVLELRDALLALQVISNMDMAITVTSQSDVNSDGRLGLEEAVFILNRVSGLNEE